MTLHRKASDTLYLRQDPATLVLEAVTFQPASILRDRMSCTVFVPSRVKVRASGGASQAYYHVSAIPAAGDLSSAAAHGGFPEQQCPATIDIFLRIPAYGNHDQAHNTTGQSPGEDLSSLYSVALTKCVAASA
jgi:hypothetical protein